MCKALVGTQEDGEDTSTARSPFARMMENGYGVQPQGLTSMFGRKGRLGYQPPAAPLAIKPPKGL